MCYNQSRLLRDGGGGGDDDDIRISTGGQLTCRFYNCYNSLLHLCRWETWIQLEEKEKPKLKTEMQNKSLFQNVYVLIIQ